MKKLLCVILAVMMLLSAAIVTSSAADTSNSTTGSGDLVYFDASGWKNVTQIYCHIWKRGGDAFIGWQLMKEKCTKVSGNKWSYDLANLDASTTMSGGLKSGEDYCIIFSAQTGKQTHDATFSKSCIGDTLKLTGKLIENPVDSEKKADEAVWINNASTYGPHIYITSIGNIVGKFLCPNEKGIEVIGNWLPTYYRSRYVDPVDALVKAFSRFGITSDSQIQDIYAYILSMKTGGDEAAMKKMLYQAFEKIKPLTLKKTKGTGYVNKTYMIPFKDKVSSVLSYSSSKPSVATVKNGIIYPHKVGKATITIKSASKKKSFKITVKNPYLKKKTITIQKGKIKTIKIVGKGKYTLYYSKNKNIAKVSKKGRIKALRKGTTKINILTNGTEITQITAVETLKTQTFMKNGIKLVIKVKVV